MAYRSFHAGGSISLAEIARHLAPDSRTLGERDPGLTAEGWFRTEHMTYPYGVQIGVVRVDADTGQATVERFLLAYDIGRSINPMLVEGQLVENRAWPTLRYGRPRASTRYGQPVRSWARTT
jgi:CO/xanthine dehydrogenase Mo-binding subunit